MSTSLSEPEAAGGGVVPGVKQQLDDLPSIPAAVDADSAVDLSKPALSNGTIFKLNRLNV